MKAHLRSCHPEHAQVMKDVEARLRHRYRLKYKGQCRACGFKPASTQSLTRPAKCPTYFQACVLHYIQNPEAKLHVGRSGHEGGLPDVRLPPASSSERCNSVHSPAKLDGVHTGPQGDQPQEGSRAGGELGQGPMELAADRMERPVPFSAVLAGNSGSVDQTCVAPRRHRGRRLSRQWIPTLHGYFRRSGNASEALLHRDGLEKEENREPGPAQAIPPSDDLLVRDDGAEVARRNSSGGHGDTMRPVLQKNGWIATADPPSWGYQKWGPVNKVAVLDQQRTPLRAVELLEKACRLSGLPDMIHKFHSTRPMAQEYKSEILPYILHISNRGEESNTLHNILSELSDSYLLHLVGLRVRPMRLKSRNIAGAVGKQTAGSHSLEGKGSTKGDDRSAAQQRTNAGPRPVLQPLQLYLSNPHNLCCFHWPSLGRQKLEHLHGARAKHGTWQAAATSRHVA